MEEKQFYYTEFTDKDDRTDTVDIGGYFLYKHLDVAANLGSPQSGLNWILHRYAEVLLIHAEALNETGNQDYSGLNAIRERANLDPLSGLSQEEFREAVWKEKWFELSFENKTWYDMVRVRKALDVLNGNFVDYVGYTPPYLSNAITTKELLFPIPLSELQNNVNLVQNPGY